MGGMEAEEYTWRVLFDTCIIMILLAFKQKRIERELFRWFSSDQKETQRGL